MQIEDFKRKLAVVILSYSDYESLEISLAAISKHLPSDTSGYCGPDIFILQNGRGTYDTERTYRVALRYQCLFPRIIRVVDWIAPNRPFHSLRELFRDKVFEKYDYILKIDDDVFPLTATWIDDLCKTYLEQQATNGEKLAYVSALVNNNPYGFIKCLEVMGLRNEFLSCYAREHCVVRGREYSLGSHRFVSKGELLEGCNGSVWGLPYLARWIHQRTTFCPEAFIEKTKALGIDFVDGKERFSINSMLFRKELWETLSEFGGDDDEELCQRYCIRYGKGIAVALSVPMCHINFFTQREENRDLMPLLREFYSRWLKLPYPISICQSKEYEIESRLRYIETLLSRQLTIGTKTADEQCRNRPIKYFLPYGLMTKWLAYKYKMKIDEPLLYYPGFKKRIWRLVKFALPYGLIEWYKRKTYNK